MSIQKDVSGIKDKMADGEEAATTSMEAVKIEEKKQIDINASDLKIVQNYCNLSRSEAIDLIADHDGNTKAALLAYLDK